MIDAGRALRLAMERADELKAESDAALDGDFADAMVLGRECFYAMYGTLEALCRMAEDDSGATGTA